MISTNVKANGEQQKTKELVVVINLYKKYLKTWKKMQEGCAGFI